MTRRVVRGFKAVYVDIGCDELPADSLLTIDLAPESSQPGATAACACQLIGPRILPVFSRLGAILRRNLPVVAALRAIFRRDPAVVDGAFAAVRGLGSPSGCANSFIGRALAVGGRPIPCAAVKIARRVITRLSRDVTKLGGDVTVPRRQPGLAAAHSRQLVGAGILAVLGRLGTIFSRYPPIDDGPLAAVRRPSTSRGGAGTFVGRALAVGGRAVSRRSVEVTRCVVASFGLPVTKLRRSVTIPRRQSRFPAAYCGQLVGPGIFTVLGSLYTVLCRHPAVVDGSFSAVRRSSSTGGGPGAFVGRAAPVARRAIPCAAIEITSRVIAPLGLSVAQLGRDVTRTGGQAGLLAVLGSLCAILRCQLAVVDRQRAVLGGLGATQGGPCTFVGRILTIARRTIACGAVEVTRRVVASLGLPVAQLGGDIAILRGQAGLPPAGSSQLVGPIILAVFGCLGAIFRCDSAIVDGSFPVVRRPRTSRGRLRAFVRRSLAVARRAISCSSVEISRRVITRFGLAVAELGSDVTVLRGQPGLPAAHSRQLVGPGILAVLGRLRTIFRRDLAVVDGSLAVVGGSSISRRGPRTLARLVLAVTGRAISRRPVKIPRRVVTRFGLPVAQRGLSIAHVGGQIAVAPLYVALARACEGALFLIGTSAVLLWARRCGSPVFSHVFGSRAREAHLRCFM